MLLPAILYLILNAEFSSSLDLFLKNEATELTDLFFENLSADPVLLDDYEISESLKKNIDKNIENFVYLLTKSENSSIPRNKRSLEKLQTNTNKYSIDIFPGSSIPTHNADDIRILKADTLWFALSLEDRNSLIIYELRNGSFKRILKENVLCKTNIAVFSSEDLHIIAVGENEFIRIFQFGASKNLTNIQNLKVSNSHYIVLWEQDRTAYLSTVNDLNADGTDTVSEIRIYKWLGKHFDSIQETISSHNIRKVVPFSIRGYYFLAVVKFKPQEDEAKSYSEIWKYDYHISKFEVFQRLRTDLCTDIKFFTSQLDGDLFHFLVVVHSTNIDSIDYYPRENSKSVIYKYEDGYFIPFRSIDTDAVEWQPIQDKEGHAALLAVTKQGLQGYQYDGWSFIESVIVSNNQTTLKYEDITALHTYRFEDEQILVVACSHCKNSTNVFKVNFTHVNPMKELHSEFLTWCTDSLRKLESFDEAELVAESLRGDLNEQISIEEDQRRQLLAALLSSEEDLVNVEDLTSEFLRSDQDHIFSEDVEADHVVFNNDVDYKLLTTVALNDFNVDDIIENVLDISEGFVLDDSAEFSALVSEKNLSPAVINNVLLKHFISLNDDIEVDVLIVDGSVTFEKGLNVEGKLNNFSVNQDSILLKEEDQEFSGNLTVNDLTVGNLSAMFLNWQSIETLSRSHQNTPSISRMDRLKVVNLDIGGFLNEVSVPVLEEHALKKEGDQILDQMYSFDSLSLRELNFQESRAGERVPEDFVLINGGEYTVSQDVAFLEGLKTNKLEVLHSLNNISVTNNGDLDILLKDSSSVQTMPLKKSFENLIVTNPIKLRYKIKNEQMELINPVIIDTEPRTLNTDIIIEGSSYVHRWLSVEDLQGQTGERSFRDVLTNGLKLTDVQIPVHLNFTQPLDLDDTIADRVNLMDPHDWLLEKSNSPQIVNGPKTFLGDLRLDGAMTIFRLNDIDIHKLQREALRTEDDQEIGADFEVDQVIADNGIFSTSTYFGQNSWNIGDSTKQFKNHLESSVLHSNLRVNTTSVKKLTVHGQINSLNISEIARDIVRKNSDFTVFGRKTFDDLFVDNLVVEGKHNNLSRLISSVMNNDITVHDDNLQVLNNMSVANMNFGGYINGVSKEDFGSMVNFKMVNDDTTEVSFDREYDQFTVFGEVFIVDNSLNGVNLSSLEHDTVKADEDHNFNYVIFGESIYVQKSLQLEGDIENLDISNIVEQNSSSITEIQDKIFVEDVSIDGTLSIEGTLNGVDLEKICKFSEPSDNLRQLKVEGDVIFVKGPQVLNINGLKIKDLKNRLWFVDKEANISGSLHLQYTIFVNSVDVEEYVDEIKLKILSQNYFSKSKQQEIPATFTFENVTFVNISTPKLTTRGRINGIRLQELPKLILIQGVPQVFESAAYFEEVTVKNLTEDSKYLVNDLNFETDVMRYDTTNIVTGTKTIKNLNVNTLKLRKNIDVQDVDVLEFLSNALLTNGTFSITGKKIFKNATFKQGLSLRGSLNGIDFNEKTVLLADSPQTISGRKSFVSQSVEPSQFKILRAKGLVNDMHLEGFVKNRTDKNQHNVLNSEIIFNNSIVVKNINVDVMYDDVNVTELLANITNLGAWEHIQDKYKKLLDMSMVVENSLKNPTSFFKYFKDIIYLDGVYDVFGLKCQDNIFRLVTFSFQNGTNSYQSFQLDLHQNQFIQTAHNVESHSKPHFMEQIYVGDRNYIYIEHPNYDYGINPYGLPHVGHLLEMISSTTFELKATFERNATNFLISFVIPGSNQACLGFIGVDMVGMQVLCDESGYHNYYWFDSIQLDHVYKASSVATTDRLYMFLALAKTPHSPPSIVVLESSTESPKFKEIQVIFEGGMINGLASAVIGNTPYVVFSFEPLQSTIDLGRITIRKFDYASQSFVHWQHVPIAAPLGVHFVTENFFEPLLLVPTADSSSPIQTLRYDGRAGFKKSSRGVSLPPRSKLRVIQNGNFLAALPEGKNSAVILGAMVQGPIRIH